MTTAGIAVIMTMAFVPASPRYAAWPNPRSSRRTKNFRHPPHRSDLLTPISLYTLMARSGDITYESFSADKAVITIQGVSAHPGTAFGVMVNALHLAANLISALPMYTRTPETTQGKQGSHVYEIGGLSSSAELSLVLRDRTGRPSPTAISAPRAMPSNNPSLFPDQPSITPQYRNMRYWLETICDR